MPRPVNQTAQILDRLTAMEHRLGKIEAQLNQTQGALGLARFVISALGITGLAALWAALSNRVNTP